jgi:hypothetical protein
VPRHSRIVHSRIVGVQSHVGRVPGCDGIARFGGCTRTRQGRAGTVNEIKSDLANVEAKLTALTAELHDANKTQTSAVESAIDALKTAVSDFSAHPGVSTLQGVTTAVGGVTTTVSNLLTSLASQCGSAPASPTP